MTTQVLPTVEIPVTHNLKSTVHESKQQTVTVLTRDQLIDTVALLLEDMLSDNGTRYTSVEEIPEVTPFHAKKLPSISLRAYIKRFADFSNCHDNVFVLALIFLDRLGEEVPDFSLDTFNVLRLLLLSMTMGVKSYDDAYYKNSYYAKIGGVSTEEFNALEKEYLVNYIQFRLYVDPETYDSYVQDLVNFHQDQNTDNQEAL
jgi:hypothetical protein